MQWSPHPARALVLAVAAVALGGGLLLVDAPGRPLVGTAAALALLLAVRDVIGRPRLAAGPDGLVVRTGLARRSLPWSGLHIRVCETRHLGIRSQTLELDTAAGPHDDDGVLVVLGRSDLGERPEHVARVLDGLRPADG